MTPMLNRFWQRYRLWLMAPPLALFVGGALSFLVLRQIGPLTPATASIPLRGNWTLEEAQAFSDFPIYWLGNEFAGLPLTYIYRSPSTEVANSLADLEAGNFVTSDAIPSDEVESRFIYGTCEIPKGVSGCALPLAIDTTLYCNIPPEMIDEQVKDAPPFDLRGASAQWIGGDHMRIWTDRLTIGIYGVDPALVSNAASAIFSANQLGASSPALPLGGSGSPSC